MWRVVVIVCGSISGQPAGCDSAAFQAPYATLEECREAGRRLGSAASAVVTAWTAARGMKPALVTVRCDVPAGAA